MTARPPVPLPAPTCCRRRAVLLALLLTLGTGVVALPSAPVAAEVTRVAQDPAPTVTSTSVAGTVDSTVEDGDGALNNADEIADENRRIWLVVGGLVLVAVALMVVTVRYWRQTKPVAAAAEAEPPAETADGDAPSEEVRRAGRSSRRSVAGADHATADSDWEPRGTGEHERIEPAPATRRARISSDQRRTAYEAARR